MKIRDYTALKVDDIKQILIQEYQYDEQDLKDIKGKTAFVEVLKGADSLNVDIDLDKIDFNSVETFEDTIDDIGIEEVIPTKGDTKWNDYVMKQFTEEELYNGNPLTEGLRRVAEKLIADITQIDSTVLQFPEPNNEKRATVKVSIRFANDQVFSGVADSYLGNTDAVYKNFPVAIAETRATGRALRSALALRKVVAAEELSTSHADDDYMGEKTHITDNQIKFIEIMCAENRLNIDIEKFIKQQGYFCTKITSLLHEDSLELQKKLSEYQQDTTKIPEIIRGFNSGWRINFT